MTNSTTTQTTPNPTRPFDFAAVREAFNARPGIITVRLASGATVTLDRPDHHRITAMNGGTFPALYLNPNGRGRRYVRLNIHAAGDRPEGNDGMLTRLILSPGPGQVVSYRDRNPCNLRRDNL